MLLGISRITILHASEQRSVICGMWNNHKWQPNYGVVSSDFSLFLLYTLKGLKVTGRKAFTV